MKLAPSPRHGSLKLIEIQRQLRCGMAVAREVQQLIESPTAELLAERDRLRKALNRVYEISRNTILNARPLLREIADTASLALVHPSAEEDPQADARAELLAQEQDNREAQGEPAGGSK